ncbi:response regulator transcription factor [Cerasicoccus maritimus]|uniref:response regulator transcription factor n=1 Tax=Cerasicoccus maritimus TaxID=490089 RepID=UPI003CCCB1FD
MQVMCLVVHGRSNKDIMHDLGLSERKVKLQISNMLPKLQIQDRTQAAIHAMKTGIVHLGAVL